MKISFVEAFCRLIESIVSNSENEDLIKGVIDNYVVAQIFLSTILVQWINKTNPEFLSKNDVENLFKDILSFINEEYGTSYIKILELLKIYKTDKINEQKPLPLNAINNAAIIIKNLHPNQFKLTIN